MWDLWLHLMNLYLLMYLASDLHSAFRQQLFWREPYKVRCTVFPVVKETIVHECKIISKNALSLWSQSVDRQKTGKHKVHFLKRRMSERVHFLECWIKVQSCVTVCSIRSHKPLIDYLMGIPVSSSEYRYRSMEGDIFHFQLIMFPAIDNIFFFLFTTDKNMIRELCSALGDTVLAQCNSAG